MCSVLFPNLCYQTWPVIGAVLYSWLYFIIKENLTSQVLAWHGALYCSLIKFACSALFHPLRQNFTIECLDVFEEFLFYRILELFDWNVSGDLEDSCPRFHFYPRFVPANACEFSSLHACVRACVRACVHACVHACVCACVHGYTYMRVLCTDCSAISLWLYSCCAMMCNENIS